VLARPNGAKAGQGGKRGYAATWIAPEAIPGCVITAYLRKIAAERSPSQPTVLTVLTPRAGRPAPRRARKRRRSGGLRPIPNLLETPSRSGPNLTAPMSERLAEVRETVGLPTLARRRLQPELWPRLD
jgi:hypothetical protein